MKGTKGKEPGRKMAHRKILIVSGLIIILCAGLFMLRGIANICQKQFYNIDADAIASIETEGIKTTSKEAKEFVQEALSDVDGSFIITSTIHVGEEEKRFQFQFKNGDYVECVCYQREESRKPAYITMTEFTYQAKDGSYVRSRRFHKSVTKGWMKYFLVHMTDYLAI